jgi:GrpB-like predicted nucleotidyltransferase (UPF0157 family)
MRQVKVVPPDPAWKGTFRAEAAALRSVLAEEGLAIHHIGSTSVPGLRAKPTVDVLVEVRKIENLDDLQEPMAVSGYEAWGEYGIPGRRFFTNDRGPERLCNVHVFEAGTPEVERHLAFRDYLREHPETARAYGDLKADLAARFPTDIEAYMDGKDAFVKRTEREALFWARASERVSRDAEGEGVRSRPQARRQADGPTC